ncbi:MAG TPA: TetR/AcrR family transcriptional regulator [Acidimicrobiales bacterium]|nr:TetR/AcrR family transcriptional regulator [Acidimicrobiales bacterium]
MPSGARDRGGAEPLRRGVPADGETLDDPAEARRAELRSLPDVRARQIEVTARLVESARDLVWDAGGPSFTVTQVVAAAGTSLKSFYRCFAGKDELLVALFEDDARRGAEALSAMVDVEAEPLERLRVVVVGLFCFLTVEGRLPYAAALVREHLRLAESHPDQLRGVLHPFVDVFEDAVTAAQVSGAVRPGDARRDARTLFHLVLSHLHALICHQIEEPPTEVADELWAFCAAALRP